MDLEYAATLFFALAILHTFLVKKFQHLALQFKEGSVLENLFHLLGEVEVVFGFWAGIFLIWIYFLGGEVSATEYLGKQNFTEPAFVLVIMTVCSTKPILDLAREIIERISTLIPLKGLLPFYITALIMGPILGSFITEPAAMTITALLLLEKLFSRSASKSLMYATLGLLFVNISIGGTLTPYAAPPVLMVAGKWGWDLNFMLTHFGWRAMIAVVISTLVVVVRFQKELRSLGREQRAQSKKIPLWVKLVHLVFLIAIVANSHHMDIFILWFLFFIGAATVTKEYQNELKIREGLLVAFFLGGLVILGGPQGWWLSPVLQSLNSIQLFLGAIGLTAFTDNAALTYLGSQVPNLAEASKYALVAGSVVGGGLTIIANAPNPAGYGILNSSFGEEGISPWNLFKSALIPTIVSAICFWPF